MSRKMIRKTCSENVLLTVKIMDYDYYRNIPYMPLHGSAARGFIVNKYASN